MLSVSFSSSSEHLLPQPAEYYGMLLPSQILCEGGQENQLAFSL